MADLIRSIGALATGGSPLQVSSPALQPPRIDFTPPAKAEGSPMQAAPQAVESGGPEGAPQAKSAGGEASLQRAAQSVQEFLDLTKSELSFKIDEGSGRSFFRVVDPKSGKVILQVPSEDVLRSARRLRESSNQANASGVFLDQEG